MQRKQIMPITVELEITFHEVYEDGTLTGMKIKTNRDDILKLVSDPNKLREFSIIHQIDSLDQVELVDRHKLAIEAAKLVNQEIELSQKISSLHYEHDRIEEKRQALEKILSFEQ